MPLTGTQTILGTALANTVLAPNADPATAAAIQAQWIELANVILNHIVANAVVNTTVTTTVVGTSVSGGPVTGTGTGAGTGTLT